MQQINFYRQRVAINVLAKDIANAKAIYEAAEGHAVIGVLSAQFSTVEEGVPEVKRWMAEVPSISVGLGAGDPAQYYKAAMIAAHVHPAHVNQTFTGSGFAAGALAATAARYGMTLIEPTGGISLDNFGIILQTCLEAGVPRVMPHVYSSIIDPQTGNTRPEDVIRLMEIVKALV
ncbi:TPA: oxo-acid lyase [Salmonella enterica subsp. houtenae serovar 47:z36:-]|nr:oxo-acid lyase [Salmonella enterica]HCM1978746.1 oxo-acid lyase [Salmonella enterica subsp. houtenae serovar 47:z36:-]